MKPRKPKAPFKIRQVHKDIAAVLVHHRGQALDAIEIFEELHHSAEHYGWQLEVREIMAAACYLEKFGFIDNHLGDFAANDKTEELFGMVIDGDGVL